ncbi:MAG: hypothetical protein ACRD44_18970 [Bryobacteraceae bacterium]
MVPVKSFEEHAEAVLDILTRAARALSAAGIEYRLAGGAAVYIYVDQVDPEAARLTRDVDLVINRRDLAGIENAARAHGFELRHAAGVDMLVDLQNPDHKRRVHFVFAGEKVHPAYVETAPAIGASVTAAGGVTVIPLADLLRMKLTSFRLKDQVHIQDLDGVGLITPDIEEALPEVLRGRLAQVRASR